MTTIRTDSAEHAAHDLAEAFAASEGDFIPFDVLRATERMVGAGTIELDDGTLIAIGAEPGAMGATLIGVIRVSHVLPPNGFERQAWTLHRRTGLRPAQTRNR